MENVEKFSDMERATNTSKQLNEKKGKNPTCGFSLRCFATFTLFGRFERWMRGVAPHPTKELFEKSSLETQKLLIKNETHRYVVSDGFLP